MTKERAPVGALPPDHFRGPTKMIPAQIHRCSRANPSAYRPAPRRRLCRLHMYSQARPLESPR